MCLAIPAKIISVLPEQKAIAYIGGVEREISTVLLDEVKEGDYVILHVGFALSKLDEDEAKKTLQLFEDMLNQKPLEA
ncbi:MAG: HypC/HybG/HupF family hydrogenase formation chaperone [Gammaproteobacteria bacterium]|nr:HypC/HybG/HupF family hydrogenase formation chaperone [Gammaproteobacteria bacterium]MBU1558487.1 HypC/HybG/HupF family hydrogenase formation chaperone [Gammaproteobacteria bacterium]MBU1628942.1 HypC/HybG/HupF family hydrogenase formation chaperone [Gammaproteobacteria bacterium]MBU1926163.1 HypC/HybG/HupF family hydrogenase formation chaperone [Gammaproteobacteria bacterium]MBU2545572.1 HypC/HybG/HupF family hydrogenase formation chaperone [Gammaproteobacteria bacterium]